jgi:hypothetical protein
MVSRLKQTREDPLLNLAMIRLWSSLDLQQWASGLVGPADRAVIKSTGLTGVQFLNLQHLDEIWTRFSKGAQQTFMRKLDKWKLDESYSQPMRCWFHKNDALFESTQSAFVKHGILKAVESIQHGNWHLFDPPIGDGQCQLRAACNAVILSKLAMAKSESRLASICMLSRVIGDTKNESQNVSSELWFLFECFILTLGKIVDPPVPGVLTQTMRTDIDILAEALDCTKLQAEYFVRIARDRVSKNSVRWLRRETRRYHEFALEVSPHQGHHHHHHHHHHKQKGLHQDLHWWNSLRAMDAIGPDFTETVRGGWPSVPMFWSYATLLALLWHQVPIIVFVKYFLAKDKENQTDKGYDIRHLNAKTVTTGSVGWIIQGISFSSSTSSLSGKDFVVWEPVEAVLLSAADHPQYPIETHSAEYKKKVETQTPQEANEFFRAKMKTELPEHQERLSPYAEYRDAACQKGCSIHNPTRFVIQHVFPGPASLAAFLDSTNEMLAVPRIRNTIVDFLC